MGFFKKAAASMGHVDKHLLKTGILASGLVIECKMTSMSVGNPESGYGTERVCDVILDISGVPGRETYRATCKHPIPLVYLPQMQTAGATVAVRVDPDDPQNIALDLAATPPEVAEEAAGSVTFSSPDGDVEVPTHASPVKGSEILARGKPCRAKLLLSQPLGQKDSVGLDAIGLILEVTADKLAPYQAQIGMGVPPAAMSLLQVGADLPARALEEWLRNPSPPDMIAIDWPAAIAEHAG